MTPDVGSLRAAADGPFVHHFGRVRENEAPVPFYSFTLLEATDADGNRHIFWVPTAALVAEPVTPEPDLRPRTECICGARILDENFENHLLRQDGKAHRALSEPAPSEREAQIEPFDDWTDREREIGVHEAVAEVERRNRERFGTPEMLGVLESLNTPTPIAGSPEAQLDVERLARATLNVIRKDRLAVTHAAGSVDPKWFSEAIAAEYARLAAATPESPG